MAARRLPETCPHCGSPMGQLWFGVRLTRRQSEIIDVINRFTKIGSAATVPYLAELFYPDKPTLVGDQTIRVIVNQINDRLAGTDRRITNDRLTGYSIKRVALTADICTARRRASNVGA
jgi:hypothetical protein